MNPPHRGTNERMSTLDDLLAAGRPPGDVPPGLAARAHARWGEERAAALAFRRWAAALLVATALVSGAVAVPAASAAPDDPFETAYDAAWEDAAVAAEADEALS